MKRLYLLLLTLGHTLLISAQASISITIPNLKNDTVRLKEGDYMSVLLASGTTDYTVDINTVLQSAAANDFTWLVAPTANSALNTANNHTATYLLQITSDSYDEKNESFQLTFDCKISGVTAYRKTVTVIIEAPPSNAIVALHDSLYSNKITYLNAYNFDFFGKLNSNYVGMFNIYEPARWRSYIDEDGSEDVLKKKFGFNAGAMRINYGLGDLDSSNVLHTDNVKLKPLDSMISTKRYLVKRNRYTREVRNATWSFYGQGLYQLNPLGERGSRTKVYFHLHAELLVSQLTSKISITTTQTDTVYYPSSLPKEFPILEEQSTESVRKKTYFSGYFGAGFTFDVNLTPTTCLFAQTTFGITNNTPNPSSVANYNGPISDRKETELFHLTRVIFNQKLSTAAKLLIGYEARGLFPRYNPLHAFYVGINLDLEKVLAPLVK